MAASSLVHSLYSEVSPLLGNDNCTTDSQIHSAVKEGLWSFLSSLKRHFCLSDSLFCHTQTFFPPFPHSMGVVLWSGHTMRYIHTAGENCNEHLCQSIHRCPAVIHGLTQISGRSQDSLLPTTSACRLCRRAMQAAFACMCCCAVVLYHYGTFLQRVPLIQLQIKTREMVPRHPSHLSSDLNENRKASCKPCRDFKGVNSLNICRNLRNSTYLIAPDLQVDLN